MSDQNIIELSAAEEGLRLKNELIAKQNQKIKLLEMQLNQAEADLCLARAELAGQLIKSVEIIIHYGNRAFPLRIKKHAILAVEPSGEESILMLSNGLNLVTREPITPALLAEMGF